MKYLKVTSTKITLAYTLVLLALPFLKAFAATDERAKELSASSQAKIGHNKVEFNKSNFASLSPIAKEIADLAGISSVFSQVEEEQRALSPGGNTSNQSEAKQKLVYLRGKLNSLMIAISAQISSTHGRIESAMAQADELRAYVSEKRNRIARRNTQVNLVSGGLTKMSGYGIALGNITAIPTNVLEVFDGAVQSTLSILAMCEQQKEKKLEHGMPDILDAFLTGEQAAKEYAPGIWLYLNHTPPGSLTYKTRREILIESWQRTNILQGQRSAQKNIEQKQIATIELLDQRLAMLSDLKSEVSEMNIGLMELSNAVALSYAADPDI